MAKLYTASYEPERAARNGGGREDEKGMNSLGAARRTGSGKKQDFQKSSAALRNHFLKKLA
ncbi:hypothetical protein [Hymenobacter elongatus]|uniref:hypothetical protein n=1 Tax=Hymenobacter elongatus TaxID=877208 RepID=UPI001081B45C|nr:hypothetical protein [Hymenobacter elongatus]